MILKDRKTLARLIAIEGITHRELAAVAGYRSHSKVGRLLRGEVPGLSDDPAQRIAERLGVPVDDLFLPDTSRKSGRLDHVNEAV